MRHEFFVTLTGGYPVWTCTLSRAGRTCRRIQGEATLLTKPAPTALAERHKSLDVLRGIAVLGILMVNIPTFFLLPEAYQYPPGDPRL